MALADIEATLAMPLAEWVLERLENCQELAAKKTGADRDGWIEDARYFAAILYRLTDDSSAEPTK